MKKITPIIFLILGVSCQPSDQSENRQNSIAPEKRDPSKIYNLMGEELPPKALPDDIRQKFKINLDSSRARLEANPDSLELIIWYGRRLAYLGRYLEAIEVYSDGITNYPTSYRLRRHRGHRYITTRQLAKAVEDYKMAAYYSINTKNQTEPDGLPNKLNIPLGNDQFNIWYHFGLAYYLNGRYDKALSAYSRCQEFSDNNDLKVATSYWQYLTYKKLGNNELAKALLDSVSAKMEIIENDAYLDLLLLFKGVNEPEKLLAKGTKENGELNPTLAYGIGSYYQHVGDFEKANGIFLQVLESLQWDAFGYLASEAELTTVFPVP